ncbi:MAG: aldo/keto reductase [Desulfovermiculus sp.]
MRYRPLGQTGEQVSNLGFGCMRLPVVDGREDSIDEEKATGLLRYAIDSGVNYVDTAYPYHQGMSEPFVGRALQGGYREKVFLATKLPSWHIQQPSDCERYLNEQLKRLQTERIDCYLLHNIKKEWWERLLDCGVLEFLDRAVQQGRIQYAGFSFHDEYDHFIRVVDSYDWDFCQIQYNFMDEHIQAGKAGLEYAGDKKLGVVVMEPLRGGSLAANVPSDIQAVWEKGGEQWTPAQWALRWVWDHPQVSVLLSGMNSLEQVEENCRVANAVRPQSMSQDELCLVDEVRKLYQERIQVDCTGCGYCLPCPNGVNIPRIFSIYNGRYMFGDKRWSHLMYTMSTNASEQADNCVQCGECEEKCPQDIPIADKLAKAHQVLSEPFK